MNYNELQIFLNKNITKEIEQSLEILLQELNNYKFQPIKENSYGYNQNKTNEQILRELSILKPTIIVYLNNIYQYIKTNNNPNYIEKLVSLKNNLDNSIEYLKEAREEYYTTWEHQKKYGNYINLIGQNNKNWKKERNNACKTILNLYKELHKLNNIILNKKTNINLNIIKNSPNYYCYLSNNEKEIIKKLN